MVYNGNSNDTFSNKITFAIKTNYLQIVCVFYTCNIFLVYQLLKSVDSLIMQSV